MSANGATGEVTPRNPFLIWGPALVSFSGGRSSAYMLWRLVQAFGGKLPSDVHVCFANTGKEREATLVFVRECAERWGVNVRWLEYRRGDPDFAEVDFVSASRAGEPFEALIAAKKYLPNWQARFCTQVLKVQAMFAFMRAETGLEPGDFLEVIGLRDDEGWRILTGMEGALKVGRRVHYPLAASHVTKPDVMNFWRGQSFDLRLKPGEGNCDLCFLKGRALRAAIIAADPSRADWWAEQEAAIGGTFDKRDSYAALRDEARAAPGFDFGDDEHDAECGLHCGAGA